MTLGLLWLWACGAPAPEPGTAGGPTADTATAAVDSGGPCAEAPVVTWENFGAGFVTQHCQACHASTSPDRHGAPVAVVFDTEGDVQAWAARVHERAVVLGDMPPLGGVTDDDRQLLDLWLTCGPPG